MTREEKTKLLRKELYFIANISSRYDMTKPSEAERIKRALLKDGHMFKTSMGEVYTRRLDEIIEGVPVTSCCLCSAHEPVDMVLCQSCMNKFAEGKNFYGAGEAVKAESYEEQHEKEDKFIDKDELADEDELSEEEYAGENLAKEEYAKEESAEEKPIEEGFAEKTVYKDKFVEDAVQNHAESTANIESVENVGFEAYSGSELEESYFKDYVDRYEDEPDDKYDDEFDDKYSGYGHEYRDDFEDDYEEDYAEDYGSDGGDIYKKILIPGLAIAAIFIVVLVGIIISRYGDGKPVYDENGVEFIINTNPKTTLKDATDARNFVDENFSWMEGWSVEFDGECDIPLGWSWTPTDMPVQYTENAFLTIDGGKYQEEMQETEGGWKYTIEKEASGEEQQGVLYVDRYGNAYLSGNFAECPVDKYIYRVK